jgi:hypothetical protein
MTKLSHRSTKLQFETDDTVWAPGGPRPVVVLATPYIAYVRLKGLKEMVPVSYGAIYHLAARLHAAKKRADKLAQKGKR